ncbi:MAG: S8/S53 family peptidase [Myxococcales bacterium]|nr:S8/S53 family peptidase [Myxococcales bacterium]
MRPFPTSAAAAAVLLLAASLPGAARAGEVPAELSERVAREGRVAVIVELAESTVPEGWLSAGAAVVDQRRRVVNRQIEAIYGLGGTDAGEVRPYPVVPFMALSVGPRALAALQASPFVRSVRASRLLTPSLNTTVPIVQSEPAAAIGFDGAGQVIVVLDSGTDGNHQNFPVGKIVDEACFADGATPAGFPQGGGNGDCPGGGDTAFGPGAGVPCSYADGCFHGTHVAGIAAGLGPTRSGVATGAGLIPIQIFSEFPASHPVCGGSPCPQAWDSDQDLALLHVYDTLRFSHTIAAVNMSFGDGVPVAGNCDAAQASTKAIVDNLRAVDIATVAATGNNGCSGTGCLDAISAPACISSVISVSASRDSDFASHFANRSSFTSLFAPGQSVNAPLYQTVDQYVTSHGTSMAAPHVAGAWAILRQAVPTGSVSSLLTALQDTGHPIPDGHGVPRIAIRDALGELGFPECGDGIDNDGDGTIDTADPGCDDAADRFETSASLPCDDGEDDDGDGWIDLADPGCRDSLWSAEDPACNDGLDNDLDGGTDWDGSPPDLHCFQAYLTDEAPSSCGLGGEAALILPALLAARARRRRHRSS